MQLVPALLLLSTAALLTGCTDDAKDGDSASTDSETDTGTIDPCAGAGGPSLLLGYPPQGSFEEMPPNSEVGLEVAPQGGFGVSISGLTTGLPSDVDGVPVDVLLETYLDGELSASFLNEQAGLYCQGDGNSLFWGVVVGFDSNKYTTTNLTELDGAIADLRVVVSDPDGNVAETTLTVEIVVE